MRRSLSMYHPRWRHTVRMMRSRVARTDTEYTRTCGIFSGLPNWPGDDLPSDRDG
jgi:hypothetical protein